MNNTEYQLDPDPRIEQLKRQAREQGLLPRETSSKGSTTQLNSEPYLTEPSMPTINPVSGIARTYPTPQTPRSRTRGVPIKLSTPLADQVKIGKPTPIVDVNAFPSKPNAVPIKQHSWPATGNRASGQLSTNPVFTRPVGNNMVDWALADKGGKITPHGGTSMARNFKTFPPPPPPPPPPPHGMAANPGHGFKAIKPVPPGLETLYRQAIPEYATQLKKPAGFRTGRLPTPRGIGGFGIGMLNFGPLDAAKMEGLTPPVQGYEPDRIPTGEIEYFTDPLSEPFPDNRRTIPDYPYETTKPNPRAGKPIYPMI